LRAQQTFRVRVVTEKLLTADEVSELLSVPVSWVRESTRGRDAGDSVGALLAL
jgi:hypothetical protein